MESRPASRDVLIQCDGIDVALGGQPVLEGVHLSIRAGQVHVLVGPNGGGKTTLLRTLLGLLPPSRGAIRWFCSGGKSTTRPFPIGYVAQRSTADFRYPVTVRDVVSMVQRNTHPRAERRRIVDHALEQLRILELANRPIGQLSGGQQQRVLVARALAQQSPLLILDEPSTGMDRASQDEFVELLRNLKRDGVAIVFSTHHPGDTLAVVDCGFRVARSVEQLPVEDLEEAHECEVHPPQATPGVPK